MGKYRFELRQESGVSGPSTEVDLFDGAVDHFGKSWAKGQSGHPWDCLLVTRLDRVDEMVRDLYLEASARTGEVQDMILASGPWVKPAGCVPYRVVLHAKVRIRVVVEYIVHTQTMRDGKYSYDNGRYFPVRDASVDSFVEAIAAFQKQFSATYTDYSLSKLVDVGGEPVSPHK